MGLTTAKPLIAEQPKGIRRSPCETPASRLEQSDPFFMDVNDGACGQGLSGHVDRQFDPVGAHRARLMWMTFGLACCAGRNDPDGDAALRL